MPRVKGTKPKTTRAFFEKTIFGVSPADLPTADLPTYGDVAR